MISGEIKVEASASALIITDITKTEFNYCFIMNFMENIKILKYCVKSSVTHAHCARYNLQI